MTSNNRKLALEKELDQLMNINELVGSLIDSIKVTKKNMLKTNDTTHNTEQLLDQWIRILSQANFTREVLKNNMWDGSGNFDESFLSTKLQEEQKLMNELEELSKENKQLSTKVAHLEDSRRIEEQRIKDLSNKRHRELGIRPGVRSKFSRLT